MGRSAEFSNYVVFPRCSVFALTEIIFCALIQIFAQIREKAISNLSDLINQKTAMERILLAKEYRVAEWLRDAYLELTQERLWAREPYSNWETDAKEWEATTSRDWESLARVFYFQAKVVASFIDTGPFSYEYDMGCNQQCDGLYADTRLCKCRLLPMVDEAFWGELESLREPLSCKLPISYLCLR